MMVSVAIYLRVSTTKQEADNQLKQIQQWVKLKGYEVYEVYTDIVTGTDDSRPAFDKLFVDAHMGKFGCVVFWALDRFSRSGTLFTLQKLKELENLKIDWHSYVEPYFSTIGDFRDVVISIMATLAKIEREKISRRTKAGLENSKKRHLVGKRGKDRRRRKPRSDRGMRRTKNGERKQGFGDVSVQTREQRGDAAEPGEEAGE